jgi:hypothetical protein
MTSEKTELNQEDIQLIYNMLQRYLTGDGVTQTNLIQLIDVLQAIIKYQKQFHEGTAGVDNFLTMTEMETLMIELNGQLQDAGRKAFRDNMKGIAGEADIVALQKKSI